MLIFLHRVFIPCTKRLIQLIHNDIFHDSYREAVRHETHHCVDDMWRGLNVNSVWLVWHDGHDWAARGNMNKSISCFSNFDFDFDIDDRMDSYDSYHMTDWWFFNNSGVNVRDRGWFPRFCICRVLGYGSTFYDLVMRCADYVRANIRIVYGRRVSSTWLDYAKTIMQISMPARSRKMTDFLDGQGSGTLNENERGALLQRRLNLFLSIFNGNWKDPNNICHYCGVGCPCGGLKSKDLAELAAGLYVEVLLASRPTVPALSRWMKCAKTSKWFLWATQFRNTLADSEIEDFQWFRVLKRISCNADANHMYCLVWEMPVCNSHHLQQNNNANKQLQHY